MKKNEPQYLPLTQEVAHLTLKKEHYKFFCLPFAMKTIYTYTTLKAISERPVTTGKPRDTHDLCEISPHTPPVYTLNKNSAFVIPVGSSANASDLYFGDTWFESCRLIWEVMSLISPTSKKKTTVKSRWSKHGVLQNFQIGREYSIHNSTNISAASKAFIKITNSEWKTLVRHITQLNENI
jgi:hypothetical protein